ncbi:predicted protein [Phaeodactylum tricornutum CCAP 1055/1]|uniref:Kinesin light chain n=2 Tax=Phaeodactylum tricornutum TaxID=2850 RepID=B7G901_PHATC|nr:predicted protein [Phaeodactylum tricornutum CCAP 1055/1]EEC44737.1 predicted protein [Phaeodactylum tricornutum CCAP 1055/1]|eukprot:XP_002183555.1 predicted protein [Phaeodactylum tricornutum CCAP 1055/1]
MRPRKGSRTRKSTRGRTWQKEIEDDDIGYAAKLGTKLSDLSNSSEEEVGASTADESTDRFISFERDLRQKHSKACKAMSKAVYHVALEEFESILADLLSRYGERHERVGAALHNVAIANLRAGSLDDAMDAIEEAIKIRSRAVGRSHPKVADSLVELGIILLSMEEHDDSLKVFQRALKLRKEEQNDVLSDDDLDESNLKIAKVLNNIGCVSFEKGELVEAKQSFEQAIVLQKGVFHSWFNMLCGADSNSPGILTMASTMCNKGYVEIEQENYLEAVKVFTESLQIQKSVLGSGNKLVQSSLDNLGYAYVMLNQNEKALKAYGEIWNAQRYSNDPKEEKVETLRKVIASYGQLKDWANVFPALEALEDLLLDMDDDKKEMTKTRKLLGEVNYQLLKLPSLSGATTRAFGCGVCTGPTEEEVNLDDWLIRKPDNTSKMSGHRVTHA